MFLFPASLHLFLSRAPRIFLSLSLSPAPAAHACGAYACIERINTHYNVSAGALETRDEERRRGEKRESGLAGHNRFLTPRSAMISAGTMEVRY
jgi:hypothetical protein